MRVRFIINPTAGRGAALSTWRRIERLVTGHPTYEAVIPPSYVATREAAADAVKNGYDRVIALGGDGTLDAVANELAETDTALGIIPCGTGNDFCKTSGIPFDAQAALQIALGTHVERFDLGLAQERHHFMNVAGVGFDAEAAAVARRFPKGLGGTLPYLLGAVTTLIRYRGVPVEIAVDDQHFEGSVTLVAIANGPQYGGGMRVAPTARRDDGLFDVYIADRMSPVALLGLLPRVYTGSHVKHPAVRMMRGERVHIRALAPVQAHVDGDLIDPTDLTFRVRPKALAVAVPG